MNLPSRATLIKHGDHTICADHAWHGEQIVADLAWSYATPLIDVLDWGPQHVDLAVQQLMRVAYFRRPVSDYGRLGYWLDIVAGSDSVMFFGERTLSRFLGIL